MEITGVRTDIQRVKIEVDILDALKEVDWTNRKILGIPQYCWLAEKDNKYVLMEEAECYHGSPWDEIVDENPSQEVIDYLKAYKTFYEFTHKVKYANLRLSM